MAVADSMNRSLNPVLLPHRRTVSLLEADGFTFTSELRKTLQEAQTTVPAKDGVVVSLRADLLCLLEAFHRLLEAGLERLRELSGAELGLSAALI
jgi:hypothetical protein